MTPKAPRVEAGSKPRPSPWPLPWQQLLVSSLFLASGLGVLLLAHPLWPRRHSSATLPAGAQALLLLVMGSLVLAGSVLERRARKADGTAAPSSDHERVLAVLQDPDRGLLDLLEILPGLTETSAIGLAARSLTTPLARPHAFDGLLTTYRDWAPHDHELGGTIAAALAKSASSTHLETLLELVQDSSYGSARGELVYALWRYRKDPRTAKALRVLCTDPQVCHQAMSAYRRAVGNEKALPFLRKLQRSQDQIVKEQAERIAAQAEKAAQAR